MTESQFTHKLLRALKQHPRLQDAWIQKHSDRVNAGIPDFSITRGRTTIWAEVKMWPNKPTKLQAWTLRCIGEGGSALITVKGNGHLVTPITMVGFLTFAELVEELAARCVHV